MMFKANFFFSNSIPQLKKIRLHVMLKNLFKLRKRILKEKKKITLRILLNSDAIMFDFRNLQPSYSR